MFGILSKEDESLKISCRGTLNRNVSLCPVSCDSRNGLKIKIKQPDRLMIIKARKVNNFRYFHDLHSRSKKETENSIYIGGNSSFCSASQLAHEKCKIFRRAEGKSDANFLSA